MAKYDVVINRTRTIESSVTLTISAKDEEAAIAKAEEKIGKAQAKAKTTADFDAAFDWEESSDDDSFEYDASEA